MKKIFALLPMVAAFALCGCGNDKKEDNKESDEPVNLEYTEDQSKAKLRELGNTNGLEVTWKFESSEDEKVETSTLGIKNGFYWLYANDDKTMVSVTEDNQIQSYTYNQEQNAFEKGIIYPVDASQYLAGVESSASMLWFAHEIPTAGEFRKTKDTTFLGRTAIEYRWNAAGAGAVASQKVIIDKDTGITLYWGVAFATIDESGSAAYEVTSFKTGNDVIIPTVLA